MNDNSRGNDAGRFLGPVMGFAAGALVGGVLGLLLAPASGEKTRRRLGETARRMGDDARQAAGDIRANVGDAASGLTADVKNAFEAGREAFLHDAEPRDYRPSTRIGLAAVPPAPPVV